MKIAFATLYDLDDVNRGSGTYHHIYKEFKNQGIEIFKVGPISVKFPVASVIFRKIAKRLLKKRYRSYQDPFVGRVIGKMVKKILNSYDYDILLTNDFAIAGYTKIEKPTILWTDAVFPHNYEKNDHPWLNNLPWFAVKFCQMVTKAGLKNAFTFVPAHWNACELSKYGFNTKKRISIVPFGSNMDDPGINISQLRINTINKKSKINILFVGKDPKRKRLKIAVDTIKILNEKGINSTLHVVGIKKGLHYPFVNYVGLLDKANEYDKKMLNKIYAKCDIFLLPSLAEGFGIAYIEASSYGMPQIGCKTQGVTTAVKDGISGKLLDLDAEPDAYAKTIVSWVKNQDLYNKLVLGARRHYEENGNWELLINRFIHEIKQIVQH